MDDRPRLIERGFPLRQASLDSVHEKSVRHGHISTLHIWPARRPLAACRAALIATLLPDPGDPIERAKLLERLGGRLVKRVRTKKLPGGRVEEQVVEETEGGILHWGRENGPDLAWFREQIRAAYGGRAPKVLDPFAGGGAIPLEAMRLGCEATAIDINPVAWFIEKCTLEYPQRLAGQRLPLPQFAVDSPEFMASFRKASGGPATKTSRGATRSLQTSMDATAPEADLAWHVRAWGWWVLQRAKADLERYYPVIDGKPTVAYLWARTVTCKNCGATLPLLKTRWLCKTDRKRVLLTMAPNRPEGARNSGVVFGVETGVLVVGNNAAQRREHDRRLGEGTMSRAGAKCPCCPTTMTMEDIRLEGQAGRLGAVMTAVVVDGAVSKEYRRPVPEEIAAAEDATGACAAAFQDVPFGLPTEPTPKGGGSGVSRAFSVDGYGFDQWHKLFTSRQLLALSIFVRWVRQTRQVLDQGTYPTRWTEAIQGYLALTVDRVVDRSSTLCRPDPSPTQSGVINTFSRFALPMTWDFIEGVTTESFSGGFLGAVEWVAKVAEHTSNFTASPSPNCLRQSAVTAVASSFDVIVTDPPYYDAIPYSDLMDFFYVWLRRTLHGLSPEIDAAFAAPLSPKWDKQKNDGELIDDASRFGGDRAKSKATYEEGMFRAFQSCHSALKPDGRLVVVFAHKHPDAWETLVSAIIRAGFVVDGSWPIQTEMVNRTRALSSAALSSSIWLVCKKRPATARPGWDNVVLEEMLANIIERLRDFWDAGIRGPDFVWAATGPALEAYSKHPVVRKATGGGVLTVAEFLSQVRRMVVDFVVGRVLPGTQADASGDLDNVTTYYLLHRHDFGLRDTPVGGCILYAVSCDLSDGTLVNGYDLLARTGNQAAAEQDDGDEDEAADVEPAESEAGGGSTVRLKKWNQRLRPTLGYEAPGNGAVPLVDQVHRLLQLWAAGDVSRVNDYLDQRGLRRNAVFHQLLQALIELARRRDDTGDDLGPLERLSNHLGVLGVAAGQRVALDLS